jgi:hypothetical protein
MWERGSTGTVVLVLRAMNVNCRRPSIFLLHPLARPTPREPPEEADIHVPQPQHLWIPAKRVTRRGESTLSIIPSFAKCRRGAHAVTFLFPQSKGCTVIKPRPAGTTNNNQGRNNGKAWKRRVPAPNSAPSHV